MSQALAPTVLSQALLPEVSEPVSQALLPQEVEPVSQAAAPTVLSQALLPEVSVAVYQATETAVLSQVPRNMVSSKLSSQAQRKMLSQRWSRTPGMERAARSGWE